jgi:hypothetical protein
VRPGYRGRGISSGSSKSRDEGVCIAQPDWHRPLFALEKERPARRAGQKDVTEATSGGWSPAQHGRCVIVHAIKGGRGWA